MAMDYLRQLLAIVDVACVYRDVLLGALDLGFSDFEDAAAHEAALGAGASAIVTRDGKGFARSKLPVFSPIQGLPSRPLPPTRHPPQTRPPLFTWSSGCARKIAATITITPNQYGAA